MTAAVLTAAVLAYLVLRLGVSALRYGRRRAALARRIAASEGEPTTLHPFVDPARCVCTGLCIDACPEHGVLAIIDGRAVVADASHCIGHRKCVEACPVDAIELIFGNAARGVEVPRLDDRFQTDVPGVFVAGELGGMGLIANALGQGKAVADHAARGLAVPDGGVGVVVVGAGPAGLAAALRLQEQGVSYVLLEQDRWGGAMRQYPRRKLVMTRPLHFPGHGDVQVGSLLKEELVELFTEVIARTGLRVDEGEKVQSIDGCDGSFRVRTSKRELLAGRVVLCLGQRGSPRKLGVPGEDLEKVQYALGAPEDFQGADILVVGGGDSAVETALALAGTGNRVTLSYRSARFDRPKPANRERVAQAAERGDVTLLLSSNLRRIDADQVTIAVGDEERVLKNDYVFLLLGGVVPTGFLKEMGVGINHHFGRDVRYFV